MDTSILCRIPIDWYQNCYFDSASSISFGPPAFKETSCTILLIEQIGIEVTPQTVCTLNSIAAKIPKYNTHTHTLYDQSTASFIQSMIWDFELNLEFFKSDIPGLLPADNDNN